MRLASVEGTAGFLLHAEFWAIVLRVVPGMLLPPACGELTDTGP